MKNLNLIIQREYNTRIRKKSFFILTLLTPILVIGLIVGPAWLGSIKNSEKKCISVVDTTGKYGKHLKAFDEYEFTVVEKNPETLKNSEDDLLFGILQINEDLSESPNSIILYSESQPPANLLYYINSTLSEFVKNEKLNKLATNTNIDSQTINQVKQIVENNSEINITTIKWDDNGLEKETSTDISSATGSILTFIMYMFIMMYGAMVMNGVVEEKSNRIVEVMISSVKPFDLMMGKIIGIGLVGLTQLFIWLIIFVGLGFAINTFGSSFGITDGDTISVIMKGLSTINWIELIMCFFLYFIGGYLIYAAIFATAGAAVDNAQDTQQFVMPITLIFIFAFYAGIYSVQNPYGPLAFWCSIIPITSPIVMIVRIPFGVPLWQIILSVIILYATIILVIKFAAKIYRVGILMYGKKPNLKEIIKWFSYK